MLGRVIEWMYPTVCPVCQKVLGKGKIICDTCKDELHIINEPRCAKCGKPLTDSGKTYCNDCKKMKHYYDRARSVFEYTGEMKLVLYRFKYGNSRDYGKFFAKVAKDVLENKLKEWNVQAIIPVPMYKDKEIKRGYNQAEVFGRALSKETGIALDDKCIIRKKFEYIRDKYKDINIDINDNVIDEIVNKCEFYEFGARRIDKIISKEIENVIIDGVIRGDKDISIDSIVKKNITS